jgi:hypothetical protein
MTVLNSLFQGAIEQIPTLMASFVRKCWHDYAVAVKTDNAVLEPLPGQFQEYPAKPKQNSTQELQTNHKAINGLKSLINEGASNKAVEDYFGEHFTKKTVAIDYDVTSINLH